MVWGPGGQRGPGDGSLVPHGALDRLESVAVGVKTEELIKGPTRPHHEVNPPGVSGGC